MNEGLHGIEAFKFLRFNVLIWTTILFSSSFDIFLVLQSAYMRRWRSLRVVSRLQRVALSKLRITFTNSEVSNLVLHYIVNYQLNLVSVLSALAKLWNGSCLIF